jgi:hypothetical protein
MKRLLAIVSLACLLAVAVAGPAAATTTKAQTSCIETMQGAPADGTQWVSEDMVLHVRGWSASYQVTGDPLCAGGSVAVANYDLDLVTGTGDLWGTLHSDLDAYDGGWDLTWTAHFTSPPFSPDATDVWAGVGVGKGFGELAGWHHRIQVIERTHLTIEEHGVAFRPGDR